MVNFNRKQQNMKSSTTNATTELDTPISILHRIAQQGELSLTYKQIKSEGYQHAPLFTYQVEVQDLIATGSGSSKKKAKHVASREMLKQMFQSRPKLIRNKNDYVLIQKIIDQHMDDQSVLDDADSAAAAPVNDLNDKDNPIGKLQEICNKKFLQLPDYSLKNEQGVTQCERQYVVECYIESITLSVTGSGKSKRDAKRNAAEKMLAKLAEYNLDKLDKILDRLPGPEASRPTHESLDLLDGISIKCNNMVNNTNITQSINEFFDRLQSNPTKMNQLSELFDHRMCIFVYQFIDDQRLYDGVENLLSNVVKLLQLQLNVVIYHQKCIDGKYQCFAELLGDDGNDGGGNGGNGNDNDRVSIVCSYAYSDNIDMAKKSAMTRCLVLLLCNIPIEVIDA